MHMHTQHTHTTFPLPRVLPFPHLAFAPSFKLSIPPSLYLSPWASPFLSGQLQLGAFCATVYEPSPFPLAACLLVLAQHTNTLNLKLVPTPPLLTLANIPV